MRNKLMICICLGFLAAVVFSGCSRDRNRSQGVQNAPANENSPAAATLAPASTQEPAQVSQPTAEPTVAPAPTEAQAQPPTVEAAAGSAEIDREADELINSLNRLTQDLNSTDTMGDVK
ncbi:MAG TPA: hypothetical protein VMT46_04885 [Anaerolineaceae bacterium]|nr:hypothetical protein [Anaerolineaceae bacterium]